MSDNGETSRSTSAASEDRERSAEPAAAAEEFKCFIGGISWHMDDRQLRDTFRDYAPTAARVMLDRVTHKSRGFGFVHFGNKADMQEAIDKMHDVEIEGRKISVTRAIPQESIKPGTPAHAFYRDDRGPDRRHERYPPRGGYDRYPPRGYGAYERGGYGYERAPHDRGYDRPGYDRGGYDRYPEYDRYERGYGGGYGGGHDRGYERDPRDAYRGDPYVRYAYEPDPYERDPYYSRSSRDPYEARDYPPERYEPERRAAYPERRSTRGPYDRER